MLGEKRSKSAFYGDSVDAVPEEIPVPEQKKAESAAEKFTDLQFGPNYPSPDRWQPPEPEEAVLLSESEPAMQESHAPARAKALRTHDLFFAAGDTHRDFTSVLREVQAYLSKEYSNLVTGDGSEEVKAQIRRYAGKYIQDHRIAVEGMSTDELIGGIYSEMAEFGFLTKYIYGEGIEEIDGATRS